MKLIAVKWINDNAWVCFIYSAYASCKEIRIYVGTACHKVIIKYGISITITLINCLT